MCPVDQVVLAPMVRGSELAFRKLINDIYGPMICYSPMIRADIVVSALEERTPTALQQQYEDYQIFSQDCSAEPSERLIVQLCGNSPNTIAKACRAILHRNANLVGIDLNLGCPQSCARDGSFGAFLHQEVAVKCVQQMRKEIDISNSASSKCRSKVQLSCKIRLLDNVEETIKFAKALSLAGCDALAVHCRKRDAKFNGKANLDAGKLIVSALDIPVYINGADVTCWKDAMKILDETGAAKLMVARPFLSNPDIFRNMSDAHSKGEDVQAASVAARYLELATVHMPPTTEYVRLHLKWFFRKALQPVNAPDFANNWRHKLWNFLQRPYLRCLDQFRAFAVLFCVSAKIPVPPPLSIDIVPSFKTIRHMKEHKKRKHAEKMSST